MESLITVSLLIMMRRRLKILVRDFYVTMMSARLQQKLYGIDINCYII